MRTFVHTDGLTWEAANYATGAMATDDSHAPDAGVTGISFRLRANGNIVDGEDVITDGYVGVDTLTDDQLRVMLAEAQAMPDASRLDDVLRVDPFD